VTETEQSLYERIGGEAGVRTLVERFYQFMYELDGVDEVRDLHVGDLDATKEKLFMYFSGWFGGPALFIDRYGHPRLRARHLHVTIGSRERDQWLTCMEHALQAMALDKALYSDLMIKIAPMADHMRNQMGEGDPIGPCSR